MNLLQAAAALVLWQSGQFDTLDIARVLTQLPDAAVSEADVCRLIDAARNRARGPDLHVVQGVLA